MILASTVLKLWSSYSDDSDHLVKVCDFLLVSNANHNSTLYHFRDIIIAI